MGLKNRLIGLGAGAAALLTTTFGAHAGNCDDDLRDFMLGKSPVVENQSSLIGAFRKDIKESERENFCVGARFHGDWTFNEFVVRIGKNANTGGLSQKELEQKLIKEYVQDPKYREQREVGFNQELDKAYEKYLEGEIRPNTNIEEDPSVDTIMFASLEDLSGSNSNDNNAVVDVDTKTQNQLGIEGLEYRAA